MAPSRGADLQEEVTSCLSIWVLSKGTLFTKTSIYCRDTYVATKNIQEDKDCGWEHQLLGQRDLVLNPFFTAYKLCDLGHIVQGIHQVT